MAQWKFRKGLQQILFYCELFTLILEGPPPPKFSPIFILPIFILMTFLHLHLRIPTT